MALHVCAPQPLSSWILIHGKPVCQRWVAVGPHSSGSNSRYMITAQPHWPSSSWANEVGLPCTSSSMPSCCQSQHACSSRCELFSHIDAAIHEDERLLDAQYWTWNTILAWLCARTIIHLVLPSSIQLGQALSPSILPACPPVVPSPFTHSQLWGREHWS